MLLGVHAALAFLALLLGVFPVETQEITVDHARLERRNVTEIGMLPHQWDVGRAPNLG